MIFLGIDTGGTFTDFILFDGQVLRVYKTLSTPESPEQAIINGIEALGLGTNEFNITHGSTVATNAVLEGKGARTALITNRGMRDILTIGRQARPSLYRLQDKPRAAPVSRELCLETGGRLAADGTLIEPLTAADLKTLAQQIKELQPEAIAINLLFSFLDEHPEKAIENIIAPHIFVSRSSQILPEYREYERGITTWLNARVGPVVEGYLSRLKHALPGVDIAVMQSSGGTIAARSAGKQAVHMLLSGPAGGLAGARYVADKAGYKKIMSFDMGGTSTDVAMIDESLQLTNEGYIGPWPVAIPMVDIHTIGAGGGSIAYIDRGGLLQLGPESAGASPGPACYGKGGEEATVTDANVILGRIRTDHFLGQRMELDYDAACLAIKRLADQLGLSTEKTAEGIIKIANEHMAQALRVISVQRGVDPRDHTLISFGGAGGLHVCALAEALAIKSAMVPVHSGVLSALGMLVAPPSRQLSKTLNLILSNTTATHIEACFAKLEDEAYQQLSTEDCNRNSITVARSTDLRYQHQTFTLNIAWQGIKKTAALFRQEHKKRYGHTLDFPIELVNLRAGLTGQKKFPVALETIHQHKTTADNNYDPVRLYGLDRPASLWQRENLHAGQLITGPALIAENISTTYISPDWRCRIDDYGNIILQRMATTGLSPS